MQWTSLPGGLPEQQTNLDVQKTFVRLAIARYVNRYTVTLNKRDKMGLVDWSRGWWICIGRIKWRFSHFVSSGFEWNLISTVKYFLFQLKFLKYLLLHENTFRFSSVTMELSGSRCVLCCDSVLRETVPKSCGHSFCRECIRYVKNYLLRIFNLSTKSVPIQFLCYRLRHCNDSAFFQEVFARPTDFFCLILRY